MERRGEVEGDGGCAKRDRGSMRTASALAEAVVKKYPAATYSPTRSPVQYHQR